MSRRRHLRRAARLAVLSAALALLAGDALAHGGSLAAADERGVDIPTWLFLLTGGGVVGASFLLTSFATDRTFVRAVHERRRDVELGGAARRALLVAARVVGLLGLVVVLAAGAFGPPAPLRNLAVLLVWVAWWAGLAMVAYLVGDAWPALNPLRTLADALPSARRTYPERLGAWPSVVGLLALVWLEVVSPVADDPRVLAGVVLGYAAVTLAGAAAFGPDAWFRRVDPVSRVFDLYGRVAPLYWDEAAGRVRARLPGAGLDEPFLRGADEVAFVVALLWVTSFDGLVGTPAWRDAAVALVGAGVPPALLYPGALLSGFALFYAVYRVAVRYGRRHADTLRPERELAARFAPSLLAIAAGYHAAHFLSYLLALSPSLLGALASPTTGDPSTLALPAWFGGVGVAFVLVGHLLAIWVAHAVSYDLFPSRLQAVRSQYALTAAMVFYTMTSLWIVTRPYAEPPFL